MSGILAETEKEGDWRVAGKLSFEPRAAAEPVDTKMKMRAIPTNEGIIREPYNLSFCSVYMFVQHLALQLFLWSFSFSLSLTASRECASGREKSAEERLVSNPRKLKYPRSLRLLWLTTTRTDLTSLR